MDGRCQTNQDCTMRDPGVDDDGLYWDMSPNLALWPPGQCNRRGNDTTMADLGNEGQPWRSTTLDIVDLTDQCHAPSAAFGGDNAFSPHSNEASTNMEWEHQNHEKRLGDLVGECCRSGFLLGGIFPYIPRPG